MAKLTKDEMKLKISDSIKDNDDLVISILEDIEDSFDNGDELNKVNSEKDELVQKYEELKTKYKERFLSSDEDKKPEEDKVLDEKEVIDVNEI